MESLLGFRPPQFSEDAAWLPGWLQQHDVEAKLSDELTNLGKPSSYHHVEELKFLQQYNAITYQPQTTQEDGYRSCHLFLSGNDSSPLSLVQPIDNVVHFRLHLSLDCNSENLPSTLEDISEERRTRTSQALSVQCIENPIVPEEKAKESEVHTFNDLGKGPNNMSKGDDHEGNTSLHEANHMDDAVELSIAASEALVIHEMFKTESFSKFIPASTVLEASLQVKQARLEAWKEGHESCHCSTEEISEIGSLSDSEDLRMEDAFEDVGLSAIESSEHFHDVEVSQVKDTLASQNQTSNEKLEYEGAALHGDILQSGDDFTKVNLKDVENDIQLQVDERIGSFSKDRQKKVTNDQSLGFDIMPKARERNHISDCSNQKVNSSFLDGSSFQASLGSPTVKSFNVAGDELLKVVSKRFESRWFGGWDCLKKEVKPCKQANHNAVISIPEPFVGETSYFSESADIAPDASSFVAPKQDERVIASSQLSIPSEGLCNNGKDVVLLTQDVARSSNLSLDDTLCSVVPCSISFDNLSSPQAVYDLEKDENQQCFGLTSECATNLRKNSVVDDKMVHEGHLTPPKINKEGMHLQVRREVTSLRTYSVLSHNGTSSEKRNHFDKLFSLGRDNVSMLNPVAHMTKEKRNCNDTSMDGNEFTVALPKNTSSPFVLTPGSQCRFQTSKALQHDLGTEKDRKPTTESQAVMECPKRKRVRFSETENEIQRKKEPEKTYVSLKPCNTPKTARSLRPPTSHSGSRTQELKKRLINSCRVGRRLMLTNIEFLVTGFSKRREKKLEGLIKKYGGTVLSDIPPPTNRGKRCKGLKPQAVPIVLCSKKLQTIKFLYGCAINAFMLKAKWLTDSICEGCILPPEQYMVVKRSVGERFASIGRPAKKDSRSPIFENLGIMLHGEKNFCTEMAKIIKHGGGQVFKTLLELVQNRDAEKIVMGVIVTENEHNVSRHLKHCASEGKIPVKSAYWIRRSLHLGKLLPLKEKTKSRTLPILKLPDFPDTLGLSQEI